MKKPIVPILICAVAILGTGVSLYLSQDTEKPVAPPQSTATNTANSTETLPVHANSPVPIETVADTPVPELSREPGALTDPISSEVAYCPGKPLLARVEVNSKFTPDLLPNQVGVIPRVYIKPNQKVSIRLRFPEAEPGARAAVSVEDGGFVGDNKPAAALTLDEKREGAFEFTSGASPGQYRVVVRQGAETRILVLWAEGQS